ncbi:hypothetical protein L6E12_24880 [Actinokineospora sp. PR83]|uniref:hypothetical protein n=1 Tax=Actinokineospora sp. PR83 TaxID=2884908 RepID=UPI001F447119|nr:hypothetical protein [Actinokineospora sp. PR83]MCG8919021.1 hypothetical protein [Actinokineospora sp. PR83]
MPNDGFEASPDQISAHAAQIDKTTALLDATVSAARARMGSEDFGLIGTLLSAACNSSMEDATAALTEALAAGQRHAAAVRGWAETSRVTEESVTALFQGER